MSYRCLRVLNVGVEPIAQRQFRFAGFDGQSALEFRRVIEPARPTLRNHFICVQNGPLYFVWRTPLSRNVRLFARRSQNHTHNSNSIKPPHWPAPYAVFCSCRSGAGACRVLPVSCSLASGRRSARCRPLIPSPHPYVRIPTQTGQQFRRNLDTDSKANWTPIPTESGQPKVIT